MATNKIDTLKRKKIKNIVQKRGGQEDRGRQTVVGVSHQSQIVRLAEQEHTGQDK